MTARATLDQPTAVRLTVDDFLLLGKAGAFNAYARTELVEGVIVAMNSQFAPHAFVKSELAFRLRIALEALGSDLLVYIEGSVSMDRFNVPMPDISIVAPFPIERAPVPGKAVRLAVEVADTSLSFDLKKKAPVYARIGIPEYWVVDLKRKRVHRLSEPGESGYGRVEHIAFGTPVAALSIAGLTVETDRLL